MMTEWEKKTDVDKIYANAVTFFNYKMSSIERYQENSMNSEKNKWFRKRKFGARNFRQDERDLAGALQLQLEEVKA